MQERGHITQDLNNLRQIGIGTQVYLNDHDAAFPLPTVNWMLELHPVAGTQYLPSWKIFQSPFDKRASSETAASAPVSYGFNSNTHGTNPTDVLSSDRITNASAFILYAPAQSGGTTSSFSGTGAAPVTVLKDTSSQGSALGGTHSKRRRINACFGDLHVENMSWTDFIDDTSTTVAKQRWNPTATGP
jgi:hypothetical protein